MIYRVIIEPAAHEELRKASDWYELRERGIGGRFAVIVDDYLRRIASAPLTFPKAGVTNRKARIQGWPYSIFFTILEEQRIVKIIAVWHGRRNPADLRRRFR